METNDAAKISLLHDLAFNESRDLKLGIRYAEQLIDLSKKLHNNLYLCRGYRVLGQKKRLLGEMDEALSAFFKSVDAAILARNPLNEGNSYMQIADVYSVVGNHTNAMLYYNKAIRSFRLSGDSIALAAVLTNAGGEYNDVGVKFNDNKKYDSALLFL